jgi:hypothetical protein
MFYEVCIFDCFWRIIVFDFMGQLNFASTLFQLLIQYILDYGIVDVANCDML